MSYYAVIEHIEEVLNECGDPVELVLTGNQMLNENGQMSIELEETVVLRKNNFCELPSPYPACNTDSTNEFKINRIRISPSLADDYSKNCPLSNDEVKNIIQNKSTLFGYYN